MELLDSKTYTNIEQFNKVWNLIMLHGTIDKNCDLQREYTGDKGAPDILHRVGNQRGHPYYDTIVCKMIAKRKSTCIEDYIEIAQELRKLIENS